MRVLGIESSCDECAVALVEDGRNVLSSIVATQIEHHAPYDGVVPELASRLHIQTIASVYRQALDESGLKQQEIDAVAVTSRPGLIGSLLVGLSFAKGLAFSLEKPLLGVDHILAHLYAVQLEAPVAYPHLGLLVSGGHTLIALVKNYDDVEVLGTTIDDAVGEAFDKVAKFYGLGYPGGKAVDQVASSGDAEAYRFPRSRLDKGSHPFDVSYSGLKTAVITQKKQFLKDGKEESLQNLCASFQKTAIDILLTKLISAAESTGVKTIVAGGGVAANSYLRDHLRGLKGLQVHYPAFDLCSDNAAMIAGIAYHYLRSGASDGWDLNAESRVPRFKRKYP